MTGLRAVELETLEPHLGFELPPLVRKSGQVTMTM
jgi:hypothetical protein